MELPEQLPEPRVVVVGGKELTVEGSAKGLMVRGTTIPELAVQALTDEERDQLRVGRGGWFRNTPTAEHYHAIANSAGAFKGVTFVPKD